MNPSSCIYHVSPIHLRELGTEVNRKNRDNAYRQHSPWNRYDEERKRATKHERTERWDRLFEEIEAAGCIWESKPIEIHLNRDRNCVIRDWVSQKSGGHHRLAIAIELGFQPVPVRFVCD